MSLLNEALRKNRSEKRHKVVFSRPSKTAIISRRGFILILLLIAVAAGFTYMWTMDRHNSMALSDTRPETRTKDNLVTPVSVAVSIPSATEKKAIEQQATEVSEVKEDSPEIKVQEHPVKEAIRDEAKKDIVQEKRAKEEKSPDIIIAEKKEDTDSYLEKAKELHRQARHDMALTMYKRVLGLDSANPEALFNMASIFITMNRYQDAYDILSALCDTEKRDSKIMLNLAVSEIGLKKFEDALSHLSTLDVDDPELLFETAFHTGVALSRMGRPDDAIKSYMEAEKINKNHPALLLNMAVLYDRYGRYSEAVDYYTKLINSNSLRPGEMGVYKNRIGQLSAHLQGTGRDGSGKEQE